MKIKFKKEYLEHFTNSLFKYLVSHDGLDLDEITYMLSASIELCLGEEYQDYKVNVDLDYNGEGYIGIKDFCISLSPKNIKNLEFDGFEGE